MRAISSRSPVTQHKIIGLNIPRGNAGFATVAAWSGPMVSLRPDCGGIETLCDPGGRDDTGRDFILSAISSPAPEDLIMRMQTHNEVL